MSKLLVDKSVLQQALCGLSLAISDTYWRSNSPTQPVMHKAYAAIRAALSQPQPEQEPKPVYLVWMKAHCAWMHTDREGFDKTEPEYRWVLYDAPTPLEASSSSTKPTTFKPVELTDVQAETLIENSDGRWHEGEFRIDGPDLMRLLKSAHGITGEGAA